MTLLTPELNLIMGQDADDTADYLTIDLAGSLSIIDGLFNATTGHNHNGSHQGGALQILDLTVGEDLTVVGTSTLQGPVSCQSTLSVSGAFTATGAATLHSTLTVDGETNIGDRLVVERVLAGGVGDAGPPWGIVTNRAINTEFWYQRGSATVRCWDNQDFTYGIPPVANTLVQRDSGGNIQAPNISDPHFLAQNAFPASGTYTLPSAVSGAGSWRYVKASGGNVTINMTAGNLILGSTTYTNGSPYILINGESISCYADGTNWYVL